jgi:TetR/AcrR family fatty acid metabolism transcriptional regulator
MKQISDRQLEILEATGHILLEQGVAGLTTKNLAIRMGFSESALYRHFKNKSEILEGHIRYLFGNVKERLSLIPLDEISSEQAIQMFMTSQFKYLNANRHFVVAMLSETLLDSDSPVRAACLEMFAYVRQFFGSLIARGLEKGEIQTVLSEDALFHCILGSFRVIMLRWKLSDFGFDLEAEGNRLMNEIITVALHNKSI